MNEKDKKNGVYQKLSTVDLSDNKLVEFWLEGLEFPLHLTKQVFKNKDDSEGFIYLITNDLSIDSSKIHEIYKKRWKVEEHHKTIKSNLKMQNLPHILLKHKLIIALRFYMQQCNGKNYQKI